MNAEPEPAVTTLAMLKQRPRLPGLDLVRAIAITWVLIYHASFDGLVPDPSVWWIRFGWMGVDLFFVLSGYLIASQLLRPFARGLRPDYARFCGRRLLRTLPAYVAILAIYFLLPQFREQPNIQPLWQFVTFTENLFIKLDTPKAFSHVWSLCVEEQFYLIFPIAVALLMIRPSAKVTAAVIALLVTLGMALRATLWLKHVGSYSTPLDQLDFRSFMHYIYYPTWSRIDGLLAGITAASIKIFRPTWWKSAMRRPNLILFLGIAGMALSMVWFGATLAPLLPSTFGYPLLAMSIALIVAAGSEPASLIGRYRVPGAGALATAAYSLYLSQKLAFQVVVSHPAWLAGSSVWFRFAAAMGLAVLAGTCLYWAVERPFLKLRDRWDGRSRTSLAKVSDDAPRPACNGSLGFTK